MRKAFEHLLIFSRPLTSLPKRSFDFGKRHALTHTVYKYRIFGAGAAANGLSREGSSGTPGGGARVVGGSRQSCPSQGTARWVGPGGAHGEGGDLSSGRGEGGSGFPSHKGPGSANARVLSFIAASRPVGTIRDIEMKHTRERLQD